MINIMIVGFYIIFSTVYIIWFISVI